MTLLDQASKIRSGEEIDEVQLRLYLSVQGLVDADTPIEIKQFPSGFSNLTYQIGQGDKEFVLRRPPIGTKAKSAHDMGREFKVLSFLKDRYPLAPKPLLLCHDLEVLGCEFYLMEKRQGLILRKDLPEALDLSPSARKQQALSALDAQIQLHNLDVTDWQSKANPKEYVQRQVEGWSNRYQKARTDDAPAYGEVIKWLSENQPADFPISFIHNDFKLDNIIFSIEEPTKVLAVLDWEMATVGDPLMDLGNSLAYWIEAKDPKFMHAFRTLPSHLEGYPTREEMVEAYGKSRNIDVSQMPYYYTFGLFRLAVIAQQIYYRFKMGQTKDPRFGQLIYGVQGLEKACLNVIETGEL